MAAEQFASLNFATTKAGLAAGTTTTITIANTVQFAIGGRAYSKAAASNAATPTTDAVTGAAFVPLPIGSSSPSGGYGCVFVVCLDSSGNIKVAQGEVVRTSADAVASSKFREAPEFPGIPDTLTPIGYIITKTDSNVAAAWTFGSSNLASGTGYSHTFVDTMILPSRPQVS